MRKNLLLTTLLFAASSAPMAAQGFDGSFDEPWETCYPDGKNAVGMQPNGWMASNVYKFYLMAVKGELVKQDEDRTKEPNGHSVIMTNEFVGVWGIGATAPGYITLGKSWAYGDIEATTNPSLEDTSDGGAYGGVEFTSRPDSLAFWAKRTHAEKAPSKGPFNPNEKASVLFYSWTGSTVSKVTTGLSTDKIEVDMVDRDQDILGKKTEGVTGDAKLVAVNEYYIEGDIAKWTRTSFAIDYKLDVNPEKMNLIISASDYFNRPALGTGNALMVDDVQFIYNSRLKTLTVGGEEVPEFDNGVFEYQLPISMIDKEIKAEAFGKDAKVTVTKNGTVVTIVVTDESAKGEKTNTYTVTFKGEFAVITLPESAPAVTYGEVLDNLGFTSNSPVPFTYSFSTEGVLEVNDEGKLCAVGAGEVLVTASQVGNDDFASAVSEPLTVNVAKAPLTVSLSEDAWCWRGQNFTEYNEGKGKCGYSLVMDGLVAADAGKSPEEILTKMPTISGNASKDGEEAGSRRVATLKGAEAANYEVTYPEEDMTINIVKNKVGAYVRYIGGGTLNASYDYYKTIRVAAGQEKYTFILDYMDAVYDDKEILAEIEQPEFICGVNKDSKVGEIFSPSMKFNGSTEFKNFDLVSNIPADAEVIVCENPGLVVADLTQVVYGDEFSMITNDKGITYSFTYTTPDMVSVTNKGVATAKKAGNVELIVQTSAKEVDEVWYGATETYVTFEIAQALLTLTAKDVTMTLDDEVPATFELEYEGWKGKDTPETVFGDQLPEAYVELPEELAVGTYPIRVKMSGELENYAVKVVEGTLEVKKGTSIQQMEQTDDKVTYANGNLYVPFGGPVSVYALTGALVGEYNDTVIPVALRAHTLYIVKTQKGAFRLWVK